MNLARPYFSLLAVAVSLVGCGGRVDALSQTSAPPSGSTPERHPPVDNSTGGKPGVGTITCDCPEIPPCYEASCDAHGGCVMTLSPAWTACDDGDVCTVSDLCDETGTCLAGGARTFDRTYGDTNAASWRTMIALEDGSFAVAGYTGWHQGTTGYDGWFAITDSQGNLLAEKVWATSDDEAVYSMARSLDGGFMLAGSRVTAGTNVAHVWVAKMDAKGAPLWDTTLDIPDSIELQSIVALHGGTFALGGATVVNGADADGWFGLIKGDGTPLDFQQISTPRSDSITAMTAMSNGDFVAAGYARDIQHERYDTWVARIEANGTQLWNVALDKDELLSVSDIVAVGADDVAVLVDVWESPNQIARVRRLSRDGVVIWSRDVVLPGSIDAPSKIVVDTDGSIVVIAGTFTQDYKGFTLSFDRLDEISGALVESARIPYDAAVYPRPYAVASQVGGTFAIAGTQWVKSTQNSWGAGYAELTRVDPWPPAGCGVSGPAWSH